MGREPTNITMDIDSFYSARNNINNLIAVPYELFIKIWISVDLSLLSKTHLATAATHLFFSK